AAARGMGVVPVLHVVLLGEAGRTRIANVVLAQEPFDLDRGVPVDQKPAPHLGLMRPAWMPDRDRARLARQQRGIREDLAGRADQPPGGVGAPAPPLLFAMPEILGDLRRVLIE